MLIHIANLIILSSFLVSDVIWLRCLSVVGGFAWIGYFTFSIPTIGWAGIGWNVVFISINLYYIIQLILERRPVHLTDQERALKHQLAPDLEARTWADILKLGKTIRHQGILIEAGNELKSVYLLLNGQLSVSHRGVSDALTAGSLIGGVSYLNNLPYPDQIESSEEVEMIHWSKPTLQEYLERTPEALTIFQQLFGSEITQQRARARKANLD